MKPFIFAGLFSIICSTAYCQTGSVRGQQFNLTGKIIEEVQLTPGCGYFAWATVVAFEVLDLTGIDYPSSSIGVIITCPGFYEKNFLEKGKTYQLVCSNENQADFDWVIVNKGLLKKNSFSLEPYAITVKKVP
ncbi:hypothetical protein MUN81_13000 [Hymenobacter sp. 5317J-9]|uniref:hypothetical protein n=1 Tax=Hymenobacter sp. 5317J-9 TaxID=2932250 RepID=UPI001FD65213|nr:hypothetical protein [Hymenobacter sp. 5317J-9]UOQ96172.1 hypothetical protein MUN81_13000 [Hymenobacter sp. 5317J-9]